MVLPDTSPPWQLQMNGQCLPLCPTCCRGDGVVSIYTMTRAAWTPQCLHRYRNLASSGNVDFGVMILHGSWSCHSWYLTHIWHLCNTLPFDRWPFSITWDSSVMG